MKIYQLVIIQLFLFASIGYAQTEIVPNLGALKVENVTLDSNQRWSYINEKGEVKTTTLEFETKQKEGFSWVILDNALFDTPPFLFRGIKETPKTVTQNTVNATLNFRKPTELYLKSTVIDDQVFFMVKDSIPFMLDGKDMSRYSVEVINLGSGITQLISRDTVEAEKLKAPKILWTGDIDGDNKMDVYTDMSIEKGKRKYTLFLSTYAKKEEVLGEACSFEVLE